MDETMKEQLLSMGFIEKDVEEALNRTNHESIEAAVTYLMNNDEDDGSVKSYKMNFVVNTALGMGVGKIAAQVAHAALGLYRDMRKQHMHEEALNEWEYEGEKKVVLKGENADILVELYEKAQNLNVPCYVVIDAGRTQIPEGSMTVLAVFGDEDKVNSITSNLNLLN